MRSIKGRDEHVYPCGIVARCVIQDYRCAPLRLECHGKAFDMDVVSSARIVTEDLPAETADTLFIVPLCVALANPHRKDLAYCSETDGDFNALVTTAD